MFNRLVSAAATLLATMVLALPAQAQSIATYLPATTSPSAPLFVSLLLPGVDYQITASGVAALAGSANFTTDPDGVPTQTVSPPYDFVNPNGGDYDFTGSGYGIGGPGRNFGLLMGTYTATPSSAADYFAIGTSELINVATPQSLYVIVNDSVFNDNSGGYAITLDAVPEPGTWAMTILGFGVAGAIVRRRRRKPAAYAA